MKLHAQNIFNKTFGFAGACAPHLQIFFMSSRVSQNVLLALLLEKRTQKYPSEHHGASSGEQRLASSLSPRRWKSSRGGAELKRTLALGAFTAEAAPARRTKCGSAFRLEGCKRVSRKKGQRFRSEKINPRGGGKEQTSNSFCFFFEKYGQGAAASAVCCSGREVENKQKKTGKSTANREIV